MKKVIYIRHAKRDGDNISSEGVTEAQAFARTVLKANGGLRPDYFVAGTLLRTWQTLSAIILGMFEVAHTSRLPQKVVLSPEPLFGGENLFQGWRNQGLVEAAKVAGSKIQGLHTVLDDADLQIVRGDAKKGVLSVFSKMKGDSTCLAVGHSPVIELAAEGFGFFELTNGLAELDGIVVTWNADSGDMSVTRL